MARVWFLATQEIEMGKRARQSRRSMVVEDAGET